jgi:fucose permease
VLDRNRGADLAVLGRYPARVLPLGSAAFFVLGIVLVLLGANQAAMARDLSMDLAASGFLGASLALGLGVGVTSAGPLVDRFPRRPLFVCACLLTAAALLTADAGMSYARAVVHVTLIGVGCGFYDTLLNATALDHWRERAASPLAILHAAATAGAVVGPPLVAWTTAGSDWASSFHGLGVLYLGLAAWAALTTLPGSRADAARATRASTQEATGRAPDRGTLFTPALFALGAVAFAYVGVENGLTLFAVPWATSGLALDESAGRTAISVFWLGLLLGRLALVPRRRPFGAGLLAACGFGGAVAVCAASALSRPEIVAAMALAGLALGPVYPVMISLAGQRFPHAAGTAAGLVGGAGALGGFLLPWLTGVVGDAAGVVAGVGVLGAFSLVIAAAALPLARRQRPLSTIIRAAGE